ncbi:ABC transporter permease [Rhodoblastus acidophilus]|uniref:ABC transporter permease n=1 Tax=Candidatus Rhodoblastus alkanivorans TaxID=2954117 RepID=A0ABS9Z5Y4_9HYPH|nr:ABC transporter permease [Candidatus Rhodoblastus alkanivorans]MCI4677322.1 ABC transporter permease [Candidatus Rhodoblastus alkanivorans]MCI4682057.1 ABC transporter permease [Candidatus Rhodoblastus alkanivorans]MDI4639359.1 ABC transporter permease [Rhodoblastus acidophilus]
MNAILNHMQNHGTLGQALSGFKAQAKVILALMVRDAVAKFGHESLGFFWIIGEPMTLTAGVMVMWSLSGSKEAAEVGVVPFALTGYSHITLWRHLIGRSILGITRNAPLFYLSRVKFFDVLLAGALLEIVAIFAAFLIVYTPLTLLGYVPVMHDPLLSIGGFLLTGWFGFAFGLVIAGISELNETAERFIHPAMYITIPATGIFTMQYWLPAKAQKVLAWSPLVNSMEMFRGGIFPPTMPVQYDVPYVIAWCVALTAIGVPFCNYAQRHANLDG